MKTAAQYPDGDASLRPDSLTGRLFNLVQGKSITARDLEMASLFTLDTLAAIVAARSSPAATPLLAWAKAEPYSAGREALVMGALSNVLEMDSMHRASAVHAGTVVVPAAFAIGRQQDIDSKIVLTAILRGCEVAFRVGAATGPQHPKLYQNTSTCGPFGAAMSAASLLSLSPQETVFAMGNAGTQAGGLWEFLSGNVLTKQIHAGRAAEIGVNSARLAAFGFSGPARILEGSRGFFAVLCPGGQAEDVLHDQNAVWGLWNNSYKPWPSPRPTHPTIDAALELSGKVRDRRIVSIEIDTYPAALALCNERHLTSEHAARFSLSYCAIAAIRDGHVGFDSFTQGAIARHAGYMEHTTVAAAEPFISSYPGSWGAEVRVQLSDGEVLRAARKHAKGDPESPMSHNEIISKAKRLLQMGELADVDNFIESVLNMRLGGPVPTFDVMSGEQVQ